MISYNITNYTDTFTNVVLIDDLTPDKLKRKYGWIFNATIKDAIIGEDSRGLVWYTGDWFSGDWDDGTWYSGTFHDGIWRNGEWYSWRLDRRQLLQQRMRIIEKDNPTYSIFKTGVWKDGIFNNGYFGGEVDIDWENGYGYQKIINSEPRWEDGTFVKGVFRNSTWLDGFWKNGYFYNSQWINGTFANGTFEGHTWWDGKFSGGDFIEGSWHDGIFTQATPTVLARFGCKPLTGTTNTETICIWYDGKFNGGEFHSGLNSISGYTVISDNHNRSHWYGGTFNNGKWYGGTLSGDTSIFNNGYWYEGVWVGGTFNNGHWYNGLWIDGTFNNGYFRNGIWNGGTFSGGYMGYEKFPLVVKEKDISVRAINKPTINISTD